MKRRVLSLAITLALCLNLCPVWVLAAEESGDNFPTTSKFTLESNKTYTSPCKVTGTMEVDTNGYTLTGSKSDALHVTSTGKLSLTGKVTSEMGVGIVVQSGGVLNVSGSDTRVMGSTHALKIASGAAAQLSAGEYFAGNTVIVAEDGDYAALLAPGCAYFSADGNPILPADMAQVKRVTISVGPCAGHSEKTYAHNPGAPTHTWTCAFCGAGESEKCTFTFDDSGKGICDLCKNEINVGVDRDSLKELAYDDTVNPAKGTVTVKVKDSALALTQDIDYTVAYSTRANVGNTTFTVTVTVTGKTYDGTFTQDYTFTKDDLEKSILQWEPNNSKSVTYTGSPVTKDNLPAVTINITTSSGVDLHDKLQYSYREQGSTAYIEGLPTNAGTYDVVVSLPGGPDYAAASSDPLELTIEKLKPIVTHPTAAKPIFNYTAQNLVTAGTLHPAAVKDGAVILFATSQNGPYSTTIPTGTNAKSYEVWYKVEETSNCNSFGPKQVGGVLIQRKEITPNITLSQLSFVYTGGKQEPIITVKDGTIEIGKEQYTVTWQNESNQQVTELINVGKYTATIKSMDSGNYTFTATAQVEIVAAPQDGLSITGFPAHVYYGDTITTLGTSGGTGAGTVTWSITPESAGCSIDPTTGRLTVKGIGSFTVKAERTVPNYGTVSDTWTFDVEPKPVTAEVTVTAKNYDGTVNVADADIKAEVKDLVDPSDAFIITGLTGTYDNASTGTNKTVTLDDSNATKADGNGKYTVSYPAAVKGDINPRSVTVSVTLSGNDLQQDANGYFYTFDGTDKTPAVTVTGTDGSYNATLVASDYSVSYANNKNVGDASVTVTAKADGNYKFDPETVQFEIKKASAQLTKSPEARDLTYTGQELELVTVGTAEGGHVEYELNGGGFSTAIPKAKEAGTYVVTYKAVGDDNHEESTVVGTVTVTIKPKEITPTITLSPTSYVYDGTAHEPAVTVMDGNDTIGATEYNLSYRDNINAGTATVTVSDANGGNYRILNGTATFQITEAPAKFLKEPQEKTDLQYTGAAQELVQAGGSNDGTVVYSVDGGNYSAEIPTKSAVGNYNIQYKVLGDANHSDTTPETLTVEIAKNEVKNPKIWLSSDTFRYTGSQQQPEITVCDDSGHLIPENEYTKTITGAKSNNMVDVDTYTVTITTPTTSNYVITDDGTGNVRTFKIVAADQETISITGTKGQVFYGEVIQLGTAGGTGSGTVTWSITGKTNTELSSTGLLTVKDSSGSITVTATRSRDNYDNISASWTFTPAKKPVTAVLTGVDKVYDGYKNTKIRAEVNAGDFAFDDSFSIPDLDGTFEDADVGNNKKVTRTDSPQAVSEAANYDIAYPLTTTASIFKADAAAPTLTGNNRVYDGTTRDLVSGGDANTLYSDARDGAYSTTVPTGTDAGTYTVWYKELGDANHNDSAPQGLQVTVDRKPVTADSTNITLTDHDLQTDNTGTNPAYSYVYDGTEKKPTVTIMDGTVEVPDSEYTVKYSGNRNVGTATVTITSNAGGNYDVSGSITFQIKAATASVINAPQPKNLTYNGSAQELVTPGTAANGHVVYSKTQTGSYTTSIPTEENAGTYTVWYKVEGDNGASDTSPVSVSVTIKPQTVNNPTILLDSQLAYSAPYTGTPVTPAVTLIVNGQLLTSNTSNYTVTYSNNTSIGTATVIVQSTGGNYQFYAVTTFQIVKAKAKFDTEPQAINLVYTGQAQELVTAGTANGIILYSTDAASYTARIPTETEIGHYTVYAKVQGGSQYEESDVLVIPVEIKVNAVGNPGVTLSTDRFHYTGAEQKPTVTLSDGNGNVIDAGEYEVTCTGDTVNPGKYTLTVRSRGIHYTFTPVQREITILAAGVDREPVGAENLTYTGSELELLADLGAAESGKTLEYSLDGVNYSAVTPKETNAGRYTIRYRVAGDTGAAPKPIEVEIAKADLVVASSPAASGTEGQYLRDITPDSGAVTFNGADVPGTFTWTNGDQQLAAGTSPQDVTFTPNDTDNFNSPVTFPVTVTVTAITSDPGGGTGSTPPADTDSSPSADTDSTPSADTGSTPQTTVQNGTASTFVSAALGSRMVRQAAANQSQNIVIKPEITSDVTKSEVSIPASTMSEIQSKTNAALTVSAPMADVTIPNEALGALGSAGGAVNVVTEQVGQSVALTLTAGGEKVDSVPGGLTLSVPAEDAGPGTVAVLVHDNGTRETIRKSVVDDGKVNIPLDGSATVEIVDNSKEFTDVPPESWASDAVAFASAHELFSGTGETTFSPDEPISRGMLATVLYSLEGSPAQEGASEFSDVSGDAWYADGVAWATANGIADGYGNGQFGPDDSITREQFTVMLWKYAGSPEASDQTLAFSDADQVSSYARQALCWAVEKGVLSGGSDGQLAPGKTATRAQAAQMLKSFMENA